MITRRELVRALNAARVPEWVVVERVQELGVADDARSLRRREQRTRLTMVVHHDVPQGRGSAQLDITSTDGDAQTLVDQARALASEAIGPAWKTVPPAAPAKVTVMDPELAKVDLVGAATRLVRGIQRGEATSVTASATILREQVAVQGRSGFRDEWNASAIRVEALVTAAERSLEVIREARRSSLLGFDSAVAAAVADLKQLATAKTPVAGRCSLLLTADAMLHGDGLGVWAVFAAQADSVVERQGLTRYRLGTPIAPNAGQVDVPLTISSDGSLEYATRSSPVSDEGDAIRRFPLVEHGISVGLGLSTREAALRQLDPNGGVRNLIVNKGTWNGKPVPGERTVAVHRLRALSIDPYSGDASLELGLAIDHGANGTQAFTGGTVRLDLVTALARAKRSDTLPSPRGAYFGPASVLIEDVELIA